MNFLKQYKHYIIAALLFLMIKIFIPAENGLTVTGVNTLAIFFFTLYLWITVGTDWVSMLALAGLIITGIYTPTQVYQLSFGHAIVPTVIACMALTSCLTSTGVTQKIATWFITRKFVRNKPYVFIAMFYLSCLLLGMFMETLTLSIIFIALAQALCNDLGYKKGDSFYSVLMLGILWHGSVTTAATPISHVLPLMLMGTAQSTMGINISFGQWMSIGIPYAFAMYILSVLIVKFIWKPDTTLFSNYDIDLVKSRVEPLKTEGKITTVIFIAVLVVWLFPEFGKTIAPDLCATLKNWGATVPPIVAVALLCMIKVKGKSIESFSNMIKTIPMGVLIFTATVCVLGTAVSSTSGGINVFMKNILAPITQNMSPLIIVGFTLLGAIIMTNFVSNTVTMLLFYSVSVPLLAASGISIVGLIILIGLISCFGVLVPSAAVTAPIFYGPEYITVKNTVKYNISLILTGFISAMIILWPLASILLK